MVPKHWTISGTTCTISGSQLTTTFDLPPTSHAAKGHILRAFYATLIQINCLNNVSLDPLQYGFRMEVGNLEAESFHCPLPDHMATNCNEVCYFTMPLQRGELTLFCILQVTVK